MSTYWTYNFFFILLITEYITFRTLDSLNLMGFHWFNIVIFNFLLFRSIGSLGYLVNKPKPARVDSERVLKATSARMLKYHGDLNDTQKADTLRAQYQDAFFYRFHRDEIVTYGAYQLNKHLFIGQGFIDLIKLSGVRTKKVQKRHLSSVLTVYCLSIVALTMSILETGSFGLSPSLLVVLNCVALFDVFRLLRNYKLNLHSHHVIDRARRMACYKVGLKVDVDVEQALRKLESLNAC